MCDVAAAETQISGMKKTLTEQKSKYSTVANQLALAQRDAALTAAGTSWMYLDLAIQVLFKAWLILMGTCSCCYLLLVTEHIGVGLLPGILVEWGCALQLLRRK